MTQNSNVDPQNIPLQDIDATARAQGTTRAKIQEALASGELSPQDVLSASQQESSYAGHDTTNQDNANQQNTNAVQPDATQRQDGYSETRGYSQSQNTAADTTQAQEGYDPTHSGARHAKNEPGTRPATPGRETGTSWGEDQQMGTTTDTPDRKNPAG